MPAMTFRKLTTILIVDAIEACLPTWKSLGYEVADRVPAEGTAEFVILKGAAGELMLQTRGSLQEDLPQVAPRAPSYMLYAQVESLAEAKKTAAASEVLVPERRTFYGALERWLALPGGTVLCLSEHKGS
jgi:hypothetical protein